MERKVKNAESWHKNFEFSSSIGERCFTEITSLYNLLSFFSWTIVLHFLPLKTNVLFLVIWLNWLPLKRSLRFVDLNFLISIFSITMVLSSSVITPKPYKVALVAATALTDIPIRSAIKALAGNFIYIWVFFFSFSLKRLVVLSLLVYVKDLVAFLLLIIKKKLLFWALLLSPISMCDTLVFFVHSSLKLTILCSF